MTKLQKLLKFHYEIRSELANILYQHDIDRLNHQVSQLKGEHEQLYGSVKIIPDDVGPISDFDGTQLNKNIINIFQSSMKGQSISLDINDVQTASADQYYAYQLNYDDLINEFNEKKIMINKLLKNQERLQASLSEKLTELYKAHDLETLGDPELMKLWEQFQQKVKCALENTEAVKV